VSWRTWLYRPALVWAFVGLTVLLAYLEEGAWDLLVWREHASLFGGWRLPELPRELLTLLVPLLILPQATHYVLDAWIWKFDGSNPGLRKYLFASPEIASPTLGRRALDALDQPARGAQQSSVAVASADELHAQR
jgi:hypothetical protein